MAGWRSRRTSRFRHTRLSGWAAWSGLSATPRWRRRHRARCSHWTGHGYGTSAPPHTAAVWPRCSNCSVATPRMPVPTHDGWSLTPTPSSSPSPSGCTTAFTARPATTGDLGPWEAAHYKAVLDANVDAIDGRIHRDDIVVLHDPQTAGLANHLIGYGVHVAWRCHIGSDRTNTFTEEAWSFSHPHLDNAGTFVFSHAAFVPAQLAGADVWIIEPSIDPLSRQEPPSDPGSGSPASWSGSAWSGRRVGRATGGDGGRRTTSRPTTPSWCRCRARDHLKDMQGVLRGFAEHLAGRTDARLALIGPSVDRGERRPRGGPGPRGVRRAVAVAPPSLPRCHPPGHPAHGRPRAQRRHRERGADGTPASWCRRACRRVSV